MTDEEGHQIHELAQQLRVDSVRCAEVAGSGHPTSSLSAADLMAVLLTRHFRYDLDDPENPANDHLVFSKGHATPLLYAMWKAAGMLTEDELATYRALGSRLEGHPTPRLPVVDVATGSLGQGLPLGVGLALATTYLDRIPCRTWVLCGDSELAEGSMWEAFQHAGHDGLDTVTAIVDVNRLGQRGPTRFGWDTGEYAVRIGAFGWHTIELDGHDIGAVDQAFQEAAATPKPTALLARTTKGAGVSEVADQEGKHGKVLGDSEGAIAELGGDRHASVRLTAPKEVPTPPVGLRGDYRRPRYDTGAAEATRTAFGAALAALGHARHDVVALDAEVADSTRLQFFAAEHPERFFQFYIAEQQMVAAAVGMQRRGWIPVVATFAAFLSRAYDFVRMAAIGRADLCLVGSHAGVAIGADGPSQMGLEDIAAFRAVHGSTVLHPCDANQTVSLVADMVDGSGIRYLRTLRGETPVIYEPDEEFPIGGSRVLRASDNDVVTLVAAGVTVHEALAAADELADDGIRVRVLDLYSVKPIDTATLHQAVSDTGFVISIEDHWPEGGLGDAVLDALAGDGCAGVVHKLAVRRMPGSATPAEQLRAAGIDREHIVATVRTHVRPRV